MSHATSLLSQSQLPPHSPRVRSRQSKPQHAQQVLLTRHLGQMLAKLLTRINWSTLSAKERSRLRPVLSSLRQATEQAEQQLQHPSWQQ